MRRQTRCSAAAAIYWPVVLAIVSCSLVIEPPEEEASGAAAATETVGRDDAIPPYSAVTPEGGAPASGGLDESGGGGKPPVGGASGAFGAAGDGGALPEGCARDCDCDGDGAFAMTPECGGDDCDDTDADVFPLQDRFFPEERESGGYDYDCDGTIEKETEIVTNCVGLALSGCAAAPEGFLGALPACGVEGIYGKCDLAPPLNATCQEAQTVSKTMRCR